MQNLEARFLGLIEPKLAAALSQKNGERVQQLCGMLMGIQSYGTVEKLYNTARLAPLQVNALVVLNQPICTYCPGHLLGANRQNPSSNGFDQTGISWLDAGFAGTLPYRMLLTSCLASVWRYACAARLILQHKGNPLASTSRKFFKGRPVALLHLPNKTCAMSRQTAGLPAIKPPMMTYISQSCCHMQRPTPFRLFACPSMCISQSAE